MGSHKCTGRFSALPVIPMLGAREGIPWSKLPDRIAKSASSGVK